MALARHKAEGRSNRHWKRNHLFNSITGNHSRLRRRSCHLEIRGSFTDPTVLSHALQRCYFPCPPENSVRNLQPDAACDCTRISFPPPPHTPAVINMYIVIEISFVTCFTSLIPRGWFGVIDQRFRHGINKAFTSLLARARGLSDGPLRCPIIQ